jgi:hypothetical protein
MFPFTISSQPWWSPPPLIKTPVILVLSNIITLLTLNYLFKDSVSNSCDTRGSHQIIKLWSSLSSLSNYEVGGGYKLSILAPYQWEHSPREKEYSNISFYNYPIKELFELF